MPIYKTAKKKDGKQQYKVVVCYTDSTGKRCQKSRIAYGSGEAKLVEMQLAAEVESKSKPQSMTVMALYTEYIAYQKHEIRQTSLDRADRLLKRDILPTFGALPLSDIDMPLLNRWRATVQQKDISVTTKNNQRKCFSALMNYAVKMGYIDRNPVKNIDPFSDPYDLDIAEEKLHYYTAEQFRKYIAVAVDCKKTIQDHALVVFFYIAFYTGMRKGEINALKWSDINDGIIHVRRSVSQKIKGSPIVETPPKNKSSYRKIQMPLPLIAILDEHKDFLRINFPDFNDDFRVVGGTHCLSDTSIENANKKFSAAAGLPHIRIHDFRHTHATLLINEGINIQEIARRLGHSNVQTTWKTYAHLYPREEERAVNILNRIPAFEKPKN